MLTENFSTLVQEIAQAANNLKNAHTRLTQAPVDYVSIFSKTDAEYQELTEAVRQLGSEVGASVAGQMYLLAAPIKTVSGWTRFVEVLQSDVSRSERGGATFLVGDLDAFKKKHATHQQFSPMQRLHIAVMQLIDPKYDARVYFSQLMLEKVYGIAAIPDSPKAPVAKKKYPVSDFFFNRPRFTSFLVLALVASMAVGYQFDKHDFAPTLAIVFFCAPIPILFFVIGPAFFVKLEEIDNFFGRNPIMHAIAMVGSMASIYIPDNMALVRSVVNQYWYAFALFYLTYFWIFAEAMYKKKTGISLWKRLERRMDGDLIWGLLSIPLALLGILFLHGIAFLIVMDMIGFTQLVNMIVALFFR